MSAREFLEWEEPETPDALAALLERYSGLLSPSERRFICMYRRAVLGTYVSEASLHVLPLDYADRAEKLLDQIRAYAHEAVPGGPRP